MNDTRLAQFARKSVILKKIKGDFLVPSPPGQPQKKRRGCFLRLGKLTTLSSRFEQRERHPAHNTKSVRLLRL